MKMNLQDARFEQTLEGRSETVKALSRGTRALLYSVLPEIVEVVWVQQKNTGYGTGPKKKTEHFCWLMPAKDHVNLGFNYGTELPDPKKLLEGTGKLFRHVKIKNPEQLNDPALRKLVQIATTHRVPPVKRNKDL